MIGLKPTQASADVTLCNATVPTTMERTSGNKIASPKQGKAAAGTREVIVPGLAMETGQGQTSAVETEGSYMFGCCGFYFVRRRYASYQ